MNSVLALTGLKNVESLVKELKVLQATYQVFYANLRGYHWLIKGPRFFELHAKFEELYNDASEKVDELAERLLQLDATPENRPSVYVKDSLLKETTGVDTTEATLKEIFESYPVLIAQERKVLEEAGKIGDEVTVGMIVDYLTEQEKLLWMLSAATR